VLSTIADARTSGALGVSAERALTNGFDLAFGVGALLCLAGAIFAALLLRPQASPTVVAAPAEEDEPEVLAA
jgi:ABC-type enterobactin transport system permease subunit